MSDRKRKADSDAYIDANDGTPLSPEVIHGQGRIVQGRRVAQQQQEVATSTYYYDNCLTLYEQYVERLNQAFAQKIAAGGEPYWLVCEYLRLIQIFKYMYQSPFTGTVLTCGLSDMESLGYDYNTNVPRAVRKDVQKIPNVCKLDCGSTYTLLQDTSGRLYSFGSQDEGGLGRPGEEAEGDLQVRDFIPHPKSRCPVNKEDECIILFKGGNAKSLVLTIHNNVYTMGCFRDYDDKQFREPPLKVEELDEKGKKYPFGFNDRPVHIYDMPPGTVMDMALGTWMAACIVNNDLVTWGVGARGELGRPVPSEEDIHDKETGKYNVEAMTNILLKPTIVRSLVGKVAISVACGQGHLMVVARERSSLASTVYASGVNGDAQLGFNDRVDRKVLTPVEYTRTNNMMIAKVECGLFHTLALSLDGRRLYGCGKNGDGQCGTQVEKPDHDAMVFTFQPVLFPQADLEIEQIACGEEHSMAVCRPYGGYRQVYTWGSTVPNMDDACVLGHGEEESKSEYVPRLLQLKKKDLKTTIEGGVWRQVSGGAQHSAFLYTPAPKDTPQDSANTTPSPARKVLRKIG